MAKSLHKKALHKKNRITIRFTDKQYERLDLAVSQESARRGELVEEATLARELIMRGVDAILADEPAPTTTS